MFDFFKLKSPIGRSYNTDPGDVVKTKKALNSLGYYDEPAHGITPYPDPSLIRGIEEFQRDNGLRTDGVMKPDGETMWMLGSVIGDISKDAQNLQSLGRNGDSILAHISPKEARMLKSKGGAGTIHPITGLLEFSDAAKKEGKYIWHTVGDGKVRSSHAERDGKIFSWDDPPEGGHPGEAPNCRCTAEDVNVDCDLLGRLIKATENNLQKALQRFNKANEKYDKAKAALKGLEDKCQENLDTALDKLGESSAKGGVIGATIGGYFGGPPAAAAGAVAGAARGALKGAKDAAWDVYDSCILDIGSSQEQADYDKAKKERDSEYFWVESYREDLAAYREEYVQGGCEN